MAFTPAAPVHRDTVDRINQEQPHLLRWNDSAADTEFVQRVLAALPPAEQWGHLSKNDGEAGHTLPGGRVSHDVICHKPTGRQVDIITGSNNHPTAGTPMWGEIDPALYRPHNVWTPQQPLHDSGTPGAGQPPPAATKLGVSFFCAMGLYVKDRARFNEVIAFYRDTLKPDYARIFYWLEGGPWAVVGTGHLSASQRQATIQAVIHQLTGIGVKPQVTVFGTWVPDRAKREGIVEECRVAIAPFKADLFLVDCVNEPGAIGFPYDAVREVGRALANEWYPLFSLASPDTLHIGVDGRRATDEEVAADTTALYRDMPAAVNAITPHWGRNPWEPHRPLGPSAVGKTIVNDEPRGYESSVSWISAPADFGQDYARSSAVGEPYTLHGEPGVWHGYCDTSSHPEWASNNSVVRWQDVPRIDEIVAELHAVRGGQSGGGGEVPIRPYPPESEIHQLGKDIQDAYDDAASPFNAEAGVWFTRTMDDYYRGTEPLAVYGAERVKELRAALGLP